MDPETHRFFKGCFNAIGISIVLWALIVAMFWGGKVIAWLIIECVL